MAGAFGIAWAWVSLVVGLSQRHANSALLQGVQKLGQVAFSAYVLQSLIGLFIFSGIGLMQFGSWSRSELFLAPFNIWGLQLLMAGAWTSRYRVGPLEALWRGLYRGDFSLGRIQP